MELFWAQGYEDTSMTDLTEAMGIASPSIYAAFGSKEALFQEAVALYQETEGAGIWAALDLEPTIRGAISAFLLGTARAYVKAGGPVGCFNVVGANPAAAGASIVSDELRRRRAHSRERLRKRFERAVVEEELRKDFDTDAAAAFFSTLQNGMSILARDGADVEIIQAVARSGVLALDALC